jgi:hypothetical protein
MREPWIHASGQQEAVGMISFCTRRTEAESAFAQGQDNAATSDDHLAEDGLGPDVVATAGTGSAQNRQQPSIERHVIFVPHRISLFGSIAPDKSGRPLSAGSLSAIRFAWSGGPDDIVTHTQVISAPKT